MNDRVEISQSSTSGLARRAASASRAAAIAPDCSGMDFFTLDRGLRDLLPLYLDDPLRAHITPHLQRLGVLAGGRLNDLANAADKHPPVLHPRDKFGRDEEWVEHHPAYHEMERIAYYEFGMHAMTHRPGVLGLNAVMPPLVKQLFHYLFAQAEFGLLCPVNLTDSSSSLVDRFGSDSIRARYLDALWSQDPANHLRCAQFMTEKIGGSDAGAAELTAVRDGEDWRLYGEKWFCSNVDADLAVLLARPEGAVAGGRGLGLFLMPKTLDDGTRNAFTITRLKDKLGSKVMPSGEILFDGALAFPMGPLDRGMKQMLEMVNSSRLSHLTRAAGMMRRCLNEALTVARHRRAFGKPIIEHALLRRQILKLMVPTEQALSALMFTSVVAAAGSAETLRILTPVVKYRACRDNVTVATGAMEVRGGNGYIEDWPNARLVRDAHLGLLWEGTSNINSLDAIQRAVGKDRAHLALRHDLSLKLTQSPSLPGQFRTRLEQGVARAFTFAEEVAASPENERFCRMAAGGLYHAITAVLLAHEGALLGEAGGDARRLILSRFVLEHRLLDRPNLSMQGLAWEDEATSLLLSEDNVTLDAARAILG